MSATIELIVPSIVTRKVESLMVLSPLTPSLPKLLLKPGRWTVGSAATCSYRIAAEGVRPRHALLLCGGQTTLLKAWDANTWHNGQPVRGEVRLQPGDHVTVGSVEFAVEFAGSSDVLDQLPDMPREVVARVRPQITTPPEPDGRDLEQIREQIQELRDELAQRVTRQPTPPPVAAPHPDLEKTTARVAELEQSADEARQVAEQTQQELALLRAEQAQRDAEWQHDREQLLAEIAGREQHLEQQTAAWNVEREQRQAELTSLTTTRQQLAAEMEQRQSALQSEATRWQTECEQLRADHQQQQAAWAAEHARLLEESLRQEDIAQQALQSAARYQQELADQSQRMLAERQQIEADRQQIQAARLESEQTLVELSAERQRVAELAAEVQSQFDDVTRRITDFEQQQSQLTRDQRVLEHSWNWVQSDRRKLVEEKEQWQQQCADWKTEREGWHAEREQLQRQLDEFASTYELKRDDHLAIQQFAADREQFETERTTWQQQREQSESERQANAAQLEAARAELQAQQQALHEEQAQLQILRTDWEVRVAEVQSERQSVDAQRLELSEECRAWEDERKAWENQLPSEPQQQLALAESPLQTLSEAWSIGVDLTAPRETSVAEEPTEPADNSDWSTSDLRHPPAEATSETQLCATEADSPATDWDSPSPATSLTDFADAAETQPTSSESPPENSEIKQSPSFETLDPATAALRRELAEKFQMPGLCYTLPVTPIANEPIDNDHAPGAKQHFGTDICSPTPCGSVDFFDSSESPRPQGPGLQPFGIAVLHPQAPDNEPATDEPAVEVLERDEVLAIDEPTSEELEHDEPVSEVFEADTTAADQLATEKPADNEPDTPPSSNPVGSSLESLQFTEDEPIDDSVSRYMQNLLARSQGNRGTDGEQSIPVKPLRTGPQSPSTGTTPVSSTNTATDSGTSADSNSLVGESSSNQAPETSSTEPVHRQDKDAVRAATEQMRQIANQQTLKNVQASNWSRLKQSIKTKSCLAAFAFVLSGGLLFLGYYYKPDFLVLGACAAGLGVLTWLDLFIAIREARRLTAQLAGRKKDA